MTRPSYVPDLPLPRGRLLLVGTGALPVALLPGWVLCLRQWFGWQVRVCLTWSAARLVSPTALAALSGSAVHGPEPDDEPGVVRHRELAEWADLVLVAPATGNFVAQCAQGQASNLALTVVAFTQAPVVLVPSLAAPVLDKPSTRRNLETLREDGRIVLPTAAGVSAHTGQAEAGAMPDILSVLQATSRELQDA